MSHICKANEPCVTETEVCNIQTETDECCDMPEKLLCLADEAWYEVLKEKMKDDIRKSCGDQMEKIAKLVNETDKAKWECKMKAKSKCDEYKQNLKNLFESACSSK